MMFEHVGVPGLAAQHIQRGSCSASSRAIDSRSQRLEDTSSIVKPHLANRVAVWPSATTLAGAMPGEREANVRQLTREGRKGRIPLPFALSAQPGAGLASADRER